MERIKNFKRTKVILLTNKQLKKATEDIVCYVTLVDGEYISPWDVNIDKVTTICNGKYAYFGFYSAKFKEELEFFEDLLKGEKRTIVKVIIPKGSMYYEGQRNFSFSVSKEHVSITTFCSNNLIIKK